MRHQPVKQSCTDCYIEYGHQMYADTDQYNQQGFVEIQNVIDHELLELVSGYLKLKLNHENSDRVPRSKGNSFEIYSDPFMELLLEKIQPVIEKVTNLILFPTYSYIRLYRNGDALSPHVDRLACEVSVSLCLTRDVGEYSAYDWPIFMNGIAVPTYPGNAVIYKGCDIQHWREPFVGIQQSQLFLHYIDRNKPYADLLKYDTRPALGCPESLKNRQKVEFAKFVAERYKGKGFRKNE